MKHSTRKTSSKQRRHRIRGSQRKPQVQRLEPRELLAFDSFEPNNSFPGADLGSSNSTYAGLTIDPNNDVDYFKWTAPAAGVVRFDALFLQAQGDLDMKLYRASDPNNSIDESVSLDDNERVRASVVQNDQLVVYLSEHNFGHTVDYALKVQLIQPDAIDAVTPNNTRSNAKDLGTGDTSLQNLNIHNQTDVDYFKWTSAVDGKLTVDASFLHADGDLVLTVEDANGAQLTSSDNKVNNERVSLNVQAGTTYFIKVEPYQQQEEQPKYSLQVDFNAPPTISSIPDVLGPIGGTTLVNFTVDDADTPLNSLILSGTSSDQFLVPNSNITFTGTGRDRTAVITSPGGFGYVNITITVRDPDGNSASDTFSLGLWTQNNAPPVISDIGNISISKNTSSGIINFTVNDAQTPANQLVVSATSSNTALIPNSNIFLGGTGTDRTIQVTPLLNQLGTTTITVTVRDATAGTASDTFLVRVVDPASVPTISVDQRCHDS